MNPQIRFPVIGLILFAVGACAGNGSQRAGRADTLYIGVAAGLGARTEAYFNGVNLAVEHLNARRASGTRPFGLRMPPADQTSQVAVAAAFRDDPTVIGVVGHTGSAQTLDAAKVYGDAEGGGRRALIAITPTATNPAVTRASEWVFRVCPTDDDAARALARYAADSLRARRVAVIYRNDLFGRGFTRTFRREFETDGRTVVERDPYLAGVTEFEAYTTRIARRGADALIIAGGSDDAVEIVRRLRAQGASMPVLGSDDLAALVADEAHVREFAAVRYTAFYNAGAAASPEAASFATEYARRFGRPPDHRAALSYDAAMLIGLAALEAGTDRRAVRDRVARVGRDDPAHEGVTGRIQFAEWGDAVDKPVLITRVGQ